MTPRRSNFRWMICSLLFFATTVNYLDRQVLSLTWKDFIAPEFHWTDADYGIIAGYFSLIYAVCNLFAGKFIDWLGTKKGYLWAIFIWSLAACLHAACGWATVHLVGGIDSVGMLPTLKAGSAVALSVASVSVWLFFGCRCALALGEAGNFPAAIKATCEYFPKRDRSLATSVFNAGSSVGAMAAPALIPPIAAKWGWESAFILIGALGFVWMGFWQFLYDKPSRNSRVNQAELDYISSDAEPVEQPSASHEPPAGSIGVLRAFTYRHTWSLILGHLFTDGVWWFFLFWTPAYLKDQFGYTSDSGMSMRLLTTLYAIVTFGSIWLCKLPAALTDRRHLNPYEARLWSMLFFAFIPSLAIFAQPLGAISAWFPAIFIGLACAGHQAWSANIHMVAGDLFPKSTVATVAGIAQFAAGASSFLLNILASRLFVKAEAMGSGFACFGTTGKPAAYMLVFCYCGIAYLLGWICMKGLVPRYRPVKL
ncbi:MAG: MFS transporter [Kiritimatiellia bacterium]